LLCFGAGVAAPGLIGQALAAATGTAGPVAAAPAVSPPPPLVRTTVMPGTVDLDKVYKSEKNANKRAALKDKDRQKYGLEGGVGAKGHVRKKNAKAN
jgi:hypothetical protein